MTFYLIHNVYYTWFDILFITVNVHEHSLEVVATLSVPFDQTVPDTL